MALTPCLDCGRLAPRGNRCPACASRRNKQKMAGSPYQTAAWRRLSRQVIGAAGCCARCGALSSLTAHHAHPLRDGGLLHGPLIVLCRVCHGELEAQLRR